MFHNVHIKCMLSLSKADSFNITGGGHFLAKLEADILNYEADILDPEADDLCPFYEADIWQGGRLSTHRYFVEVMIIHHKNWLERLH